MKKTAKLVLVVCLAIGLAIAFTGCGTTKPKAELPELQPSAGNAVVYLLNLEIRSVDGKKVGWKAGKQYEITAGTHILDGSYVSGYTLRGDPVNRTVSSTGLFEEGKTYTLIAEGRYDGGSTIFNDRSVLEIIEKVHPQSQISLPRPYYRFIRFSPDGSMVMLPDNKAIEIYNVRDRTVTKRLTGHSSNVSSGIWCSDGAKIVTSDEGGTIKVWNAATGSEIFSIKGQKNTYVRTATPDGTKIIGNSGSVLKVWDIASGNELVSVKDYEASSYVYVVGMAVSPDGRYFAARFKDTMRVYPINGGEPILTIGNDKPTEFDRFAPLAFKNSQTVLVSRNRKATVNEKEKFNPGSDVGELATVDINTGKITTLQSPMRVPKAVYSNDGTKIIVASDTGLFIRILDAETGTVVSKIAMSFNLVPTLNL